MSDLWTDIQGRRYPGYGCCIYCGSDGGADGLRDEHIIPFALGGKAYIEKASCVSCERRINPVDTHLGRAVYGQHRFQLVILTRKPKQRPASLPANFTVEGNSIDLDLSIKDHPYALALPVWGPAGFFRGASIDAPFPTRYVHVYNVTPPNLRETLNISEDQDFRVWASGHIDVSLFARAMTKIAYCHMITKYGLDGFRRLVLPEIILGTCPAVPYFVGVSTADPPPKYAAKAQHTIKFTDLTWPTSEFKLHLVSIRLFAHSGTEQHGMPIYHVIGGAPKLRQGRNH
jgi:hypothetical protein